MFEVNQRTGPRVAAARLGSTLHRTILFLGMLINQLETSKDQAWLAPCQ